MVIYDKIRELCDDYLYSGEGGLTVIGIVSILTLGIGVISFVLAWVRNVIKGGN